MKFTFTSNEINDSSLFNLKVADGIFQQLI